MVERMTLNHVVAGSSPAVGVLAHIFCIPFNFDGIYFCDIAPKQKRVASMYKSSCTIRDLNPGPSVHKTEALPAAPIVLENRIQYAQCGGRTHDLRIMRPTRCQLRQSC